MCIAHGRLYIGMAEELLYSAKIHSMLPIGLPGNEASWKLTHSMPADFLPFAKVSLG